MSRVEALEKAAPSDEVAENRAALDVDGIAAMGVDAWQQGYRWPVPDLEFNEFAAAIWGLWLDVAAELPVGDQDIYLADCRMPGFLLQYIHLAAACHRLEAEEREVVAGSVATPYLSPDWAAFAGPSATGCVSSGVVKRTVRAAAKTTLLSRPALLGDRVAAVTGRATTWALGSRTPLRAGYLERKRLACRFLTVADFASGAASADLSDVLRKAVASFIDSVADLAQQRMDIAIDRSAAANCWICRFRRLQGLAAAVYARKRLPKTLLLTDLGIPAHRMIARVLGRSGTEVIGFHHGNDMGIIPGLAVDIVDLLAVDRFIVPSATCAQWRRAQYRTGKLADLHPVEFEPIDTGCYAAWLEEGRREPLPARVERVMIVGFPANANRYAHFAAHWPLSQLDLEIRLVRTLAEEGFSVLYKAHPEWEHELRHLFSNLPCRFVDGHLEECWTEADALVFPRTSSTSFGFALCTNRPIVLLDTAGQEWVPEAHEMLSRRCRMVPARTDDGLRVRFDSDGLVAALRVPIEETDQAFVLQAMCNR